MPINYLNKLERQFHQLEHIKQAQHEIIDALVKNKATPNNAILGKLKPTQDKFSDLSQPARFIAEQQFESYIKQILSDTHALPVINTIFYVSESEYVQHSITCDRAEAGWYIIQAPISAQFTTVFLIGELYSKFELGSCYFIHNQTESNGDLIEAILGEDIIFDGITLVGSTCSALAEGMLYIPAQLNAGALSTVIIEFRV